MSEANKALVRRWFQEVWNEGRAEVIDELLAEDAVIHGLVDGTGGEERAGVERLVEAVHVDDRRPQPLRRVGPRERDVAAGMLARQEISDRAAGGVRHTASIG